MGQLKELYEFFIEEHLDWIKLKNEENKVLQRIREKNQSNWKIVESCREIMFENARFIDILRRDVENDRKQIKEFG